MSKIRIKNFGPIKEGLLENDGWLDIKKVTVFIGNQGSGKSTAAKLFSTMSWLEKSLIRHGKEVVQNTHEFLQHFRYQGLQDYFTPTSEIEYKGSSFHIDYNAKRKGSSPTEITALKRNKYAVPKIMYIPAERVFFSAIKEAFNQKKLPEHLFAFAEELMNAQINTVNKPVDLPFSEYRYRYDQNTGTSFLMSPDHDDLDLSNAASGFQSSIPMFLVTRYLTKLLENKNIHPREVMGVNQYIRMNEEISKISLDKSLSGYERELRLKEIESRYINKYLINIVEEPELNLFPSSQKQILNSLLGFNKRLISNKLIITTHSPYIINYLTVAVHGAYVYKKIKNSENKKNLIEKLKQIVPVKSLIEADDVEIYQFDETKGIITKLPSPHGIPTDKNYLNQSIAEGNSMFDSLLDIEEEYEFELSGK